MNTKDIVVGKMIRYFLTQEKMTMKELGNKLGKTESTVSKWVSGASTPMAKDLSTMTFIFNTDINTLMYGGEQSTSTILTLITETSTKLEPSRQKKVYNFAEEQLEEQEKEPLNQRSPNNNLAEFEEYRNQKVISGRSTAAGPPIDGDTQDSQAAVMVVDQREVPKNADEIVTIAGDSMEPLILQGEQVFIHWTPVIEQGDIALVSIIDEGVTCKKVYWDDKEFTLHSINEAYEDMVYPLSDVRIIGKVL